MNLQQTIRRILKEEIDSPKIKLERLIERKGLRDVVKMIGVDKVSNILETTPLQLIRDFFLDKTFSIKDFDINVGGYDFTFEITDIDEDNDVWYIYAKIGDGTVMLLTDDNYEPKDLWDSDLWQEDYWWEIQKEINDLIYDVIKPFIYKNLELDMQHNLM